MKKLEEFLKVLNINCTRQPMRMSWLLTTATTKEDRQKKLEQFFRLALAKVSVVNYAGVATYLYEQVL